jgi:hypothetical protein
VDCYLAGVPTRRVDKLVKRLDLDAIREGLHPRLVSLLHQPWDAPLQHLPRRIRPPAPANTAAVDRFMHHAHVVVTDGDSCRFV